MHHIPLNARGRGRPVCEGLTQRQIEVVRAYAKAGTMEATVAALGGTHALGTIKAHLDTARRKLGVSHVSQIPYAYFKATGDNPLTEDDDV